MMNKKKKKSFTFLVKKRNFFLRKPSISLDFFETYAIGRKLYDLLT